MESATGIALLAWMTALSVVDIRARRLPNALTLPGAVVIPAGAAVCGHGLAAMVGAATLAGAYLVVHLISPAAMGAGDVKLALGLGALTGACGVDVWALAALGAPVVTAVWGLIGGLRRVPHGPSMCLATAAAVLLAASAR
jgi:leader peptidase (prepilin peptidase)/N-methyltransferase